MTDRKVNLLDSDIVKMWNHLSSMGSIMHSDSSRKENFNSHNVEDDMVFDRLTFNLLHVLGGEMKS